MCVCVCVCTLACVRARACVCVCVCDTASSSGQASSGPAHDYIREQSYPRQPDVYHMAIRYCEDNSIYKRRQSYFSECFIKLSSMPLAEWQKMILSAPGHDMPFPVCFACWVRTLHDAVVWNTNFKAENEILKHFT